MNKRKIPLEQQVTVCDVIKILIVKNLSKRKSINGIPILGSSNKKTLEVLEKSLNMYVDTIYRKDFLRYYFGDIDSQFLSFYVAYLTKKGEQEGHSGAIRARLATLKAVFHYAKLSLQMDIDMDIFSCVNQHLKMKPSLHEPLSYDIVRKIENLDKKQFTKKQLLHIDLFLFSVYAHGMSVSDISYLKKECMRKDELIYQTFKNGAKVVIPLHDKAEKIIKKYNSQSFGEFLLPVFNGKHYSQTQRDHRIMRMSRNVNRTLVLVRSKIGFQTKITWCSAKKLFDSLNSDKELRRKWINKNI